MAILYPYTVGVILYTLHGPVLYYMYKNISTYALSSIYGVSDQAECCCATMYGGEYTQSGAHLWLVSGVLSPEESVGVVVRQEEVGEGEREGRAGQPTQLVPLQVQPPQAPGGPQKLTATDLYIHVVNVAG